MQYLSPGDSIIVDGTMKTVLCKRRYDGKDGTVLIFVTIRFVKPKSEP
jgi:single-stranded DNA-binding protein